MGGGEEASRAQGGNGQPVGIEFSNGQLESLASQVSEGAVGRGMLSWDGLGGRG